MTHHAASVVATVKVWSPKLGDRVKVFPEFLDAVDSEMIPVGGERGLVVWQVLLEAQTCGPP